MASRETADSEKARSEHAALVREIQAHDHRYYVLDDPQITDAAYDELMQALRRLEAAHPDLVTADSPTQRVGGEARPFATKVKRAVRMLSLDNAYSTADLEAFHARVVEGLPDAEVPRYVVEPKLDGASIEVVYEAGRLARASTRGDGETGEDITANVRTIRAVPARIAYEGTLTLRGEVVIYKRDLDAMNAERAAEGLETYANPRNAAAGAVRMLDPKEVARRPLRVLFYQAVEGETLQKTHSDTLAWLAELGLPTHRLHTVVGWEGVAEAIAAVDRARKSYPYETDGAVVKVDAYRQQGMLGRTSKFPKWAIAYKFPAERAITTVREILIQVGRTGALTPVAVMDPVELGGTTVSRASLHNGDQIRELDVRIGDQVEIQKAGEIIPQVMAVVDHTGEGRDRPPPFAMPETCPECGTKVVARLREAGKPELGAEAALRCPNRACPAQVKGRILYFASRGAMAIDHLGESLVDALATAGHVKDVADLYDLDAATLESLPRMGKKSAENVVTSIAASKERTLDRLTAGLGIPQIGQVAGRQLAEEAGSLEALLAWTSDEAREHVGHIHGFGPKMVDSVVDFLADPVERAVLEKLQARHVGRPQPKAEVATGPLTGMSFCVTGVLSRKRDDVHADLRKQGGTIHDAVKKGTTFLVAGDKTGKTKLDQAKKHGTRVLDEPALERLLAGDLPPTA